MIISKVWSRYIENFDISAGDTIRYDIGLSISNRYFDISKQHYSHHIIMQKILGGNSGDNRPSNWVECSGYNWYANAIHLSSSCVRLAFDATHASRVACSFNHCTSSTPSRCVAVARFFRFHYSHWYDQRNENSSVRFVGCSKTACQKPCWHWEKCKYK